MTCSASTVSRALNRRGITGLRVRQTGDAVLVTVPYPPGPAEELTYGIEAALHGYETAAAVGTDRTLVIVSRVDPDLWYATSENRTRIGGPTFRGRQRGIGRQAR